MNEDQLPTDLDKLRVVFEKHIEQGEKMENLVNSDEWKFLVSFLEKVYDRMQKHVMEPNFTASGQRQEDFSRGSAKALRILIDTPQKFVRKKAEAEKKLTEHEQAEDQQSGSGSTDIAF